MRDHWTVAEYRRYLETGKFPDDEDREQLEQEYEQIEREGKLMTLIIEPDHKPKRTKYGNEKCHEDGMCFDSKHELNVYRWMKARKERGELRWVFVHVPFRLSCGIVYWADFMTILPDGTVEAVWDAKSAPTAENRVYINKKKMLRSEWGIQINEVTRKDADGQGGYCNSDWVSAYAHDD